MRAGLDTSALNWLTDTPLALGPILIARSLGLVEILVTPEAADEIRRTPDAERRAQLEAVLSQLWPLTPTRVQRLGSFRLGMARLPTEEDEAQVGAVGFLRRGIDRDLVTNAAGYRSDVFVTRDGEMSKRKKNRLEAEISGTRVVEPDAFVADARRLLEDSSGPEVM